jgi:hypothetical protein
MVVKSSQCFTPVRGKAMRVTKVDGCGRPIYGEDSSVVSDGFVSISFTANTDEGEEINVANAAGKTCVRDTPCPQFLNYGVEIEFCNVDPYLFALLSGQDVITVPELDENGDPTGNETAIGFSVCTDNDACGQGFALEAWTGAPGVECDDEAAADAVPGGYILLPFLQGGVVGDFTIENDAISFTITGAVTKDGTKWGAGPFAVQHDPATGQAIPLTTPVRSCDHLRVMQTTVAPPTPYCGPIPALDPSGAPVEGVTTTPGAAETGAVFAPTPAGTDPFWIDFGDGSWDYSADGADLEHTYEVAGTYTVTVYRGSTSYTTTVTVPVATS